MPYDPLLERLQSLRRGVEWDAQDANENIHELRQALINLMEIVEDLMQRRR